MGDDFPLFGMLMEYAARQRGVHDSIIWKNSEKLRAEDDEFSRTTEKIVREMVSLGVPMQILDYLVHKQNQLKLFASTFVVDKYASSRESAKNQSFESNLNIAKVIYTASPNLDVDDIKSILDRLTYYAIEGIVAEHQKNYAKRLRYHENYQTEMATLSNYLQSHLN